MNENIQKWVDQDSRRRKIVRHKFGGADLEWQLSKNVKLVSPLSDFPNDATPEEFSRFWLEQESNCAAYAIRCAKAQLKTQKEHLMAAQKELCRMESFDEEGND